MANGTLKVSNIETSSGSGTITLGQSGETVDMSNATQTGVGGTNTPAFFAELSADQTGIADNTATTIIFNSERYDTNTAYNTSDGKFTVPSGQGGKYFFYSTIFCTSGGNNFNSTFMFFDKNNGTKLNEEYWDISTGSTTGFTNKTSGVFNLSAGDIIKVQAYADMSSGGTWNCNQNSLSASRCYFLGYKIIE